jgi:hypothetical protein
MLCKGYDLVTIAQYLMQIHKVAIKVVHLYFIPYYITNLCGRYVYVQTIASVN